MVREPPIAHTSIVAVHAAGREQMILVDRQRSIRQIYRSPYVEVAISLSLSEWQASKRTATTVELRIELMCNRPVPAFSSQEFSVIHSSDGAPAFSVGASAGCGTGSRAPSRKASRPSGFDPSRDHGVARRRHSPSGPAVISFRRRYHCPSAGAFLTGLATAVGPASRRVRRVGAMLTLLRLPLTPACASLRRDFASHRWERNWKLNPTWAYCHKAAHSVSSSTRFLDAFTKGWAKDDP